ncbi:PAS domain S-box protein, partial [Candidatus Thorarchaeota archaeon]
MDKRFRESEGGKSSVRVGGRIIPFQDLVDLMNDAFVVVDENEEITYVNRSFVELIGHPADEITGRSLRTFLPEEEWKKVTKIQEKR